MLRDEQLRCTCIVRKFVSRETVFFHESNVLSFPSPKFVPPLGEHIKQAALDHSNNLKVSRLYSLSRVTFSFFASVSLRTGHLYKSMKHLW